MKLFCANCGQRLALIRKALPKLGIIVDLVQYHKCPDTISTELKFDFDAPVASAVEGFNKCVLSLNQLEPLRVLTPVSKDINKGTENRKGFGMVGTNDLRDRRFDAEKPATTSAPGSIADQIRSMSNSIPAHEVDEIERGGPKENESSEMGD
jgi:hypothetical protein